MRKTMNAPDNHQPVLFLSHGSPMTALEDNALTAIWCGLNARLQRPEAILVVSAHWTTRLPMISGAERPETIHDFYGFPPSLYSLSYPVSGAPALALEIKQRFLQKGILAAIDAGRGLDHGAWIPLRFLFPEGNIPVLQLSVQPGLGARHHFLMGQALAGCTRENILIIASGHMTHNLSDLGRRNSPSEASVLFRETAHAYLMAGDLDAFLEWQSEIPYAVAAHPTPEHFLPLLVALGAVGRGYAIESLGGGWVDNALAADCYRLLSRDEASKSAER